jgi:hypothetical protein
MSTTIGKPVSPTFVEHAWLALGEIIQGLRSNDLPAVADDLEHALRVLSRHQSEIEGVLEDALRDAGRIDQSAIPVERLRQQGRERRARLWKIVERFRGDNSPGVLNRLVGEMERFFLGRPAQYATFVFTFGPYRGRSIGEVSTWYLRSLVRDGQPPFAVPIAQRELDYRARVGGKDGEPR